MQDNIPNGPALWGGRSAVSNGAEEASGVSGSGAAEEFAGCVGPYNSVTGYKYDMAGYVVGKAYSACNYDYCYVSSC